MFQLSPVYPHTRRHCPSQQKTASWPCVGQRSLNKKNATCTPTV